MSIPVLKVARLKATCEAASQSAFICACHICFNGAVFHFHIRKAAGYSCWTVVAGGGIVWGDILPRQALTTDHN